MPDNSEHLEVATDAARGGETPHIARYVLLFSVTMVVVAFAVMLLIWS